MITIDFDTLRFIGLTQAIAGTIHTFEHPTPGATLARVIEVQREWMVLHDGRAPYQARMLARLVQELVQQDASLAVGDWVLAEQHAGGESWISARVPPLTHIARRSAEGRRQSLASNIDTALLVMGLDHDFNPRRMERYLALTQAAGVAPVIVLTKADIGIDVDERVAQLAKRLPPTIPMLALNALGAQPARELAPWLGVGQTLILLGSSGAGKSTLTNALTASAQETGGVREGDGRGRHTTTSRSLHLCPGGACIIDTPGLRSWQPDADEKQITASFADIEALAASCQFRDCHHDGEPGCAVAGTVDPDRLRNYHKLLREARRSQQTPLDRIAERNKWKVLMRSVEARNRMKQE